MDRLLREPVLWLLGTMIGFLLYFGLSEGSAFAVIMSAGYGVIGVLQARTILRGSETGAPFTAGLHWARMIVLKGLTGATAAGFVAMVLWRENRWMDSWGGWIFSRLVVLTLLLWIVESVYRRRAKKRDSR